MLTDWKDLPKPIFKHLKREHADKLLSQGEIRLGTLIDFRREEEMGSRIGDVEEGRYRMTVGSARGLDLPESFRQVTAGALDGAHLYNISLEARSEDCHVLCLSLYREPSVTVGFDYDCALEVTNLKALSCVLALLLKERYGQDCRVKAGLCQYRTRETDVHEYEELDPAFVKPLEYEGQREFRVALCLHKPVPLEPQMFADMRIASCFRAR